MPNPFTFDNDHNDTLDRYASGVAEDEAARAAAARSEQEAAFEDELDEIEVNIECGDFEGDDIIEGVRPHLARLIAEYPRALWAKNPRVYWALLMSELGATDDDDLLEQYEAVAESANFKRARVYAKASNPELFARIVALEKKAWQVLEEERRKAEKAARIAAEKAEEERRKAEEAEAARKAALAQKYAVGQTITFGTYEQGHGEAPLEWRILAKEAGRLLVISKDILDCRHYHAINNADVTWESCSLRKWLQESFFEAAFSQEEKARILPSRLPNGNNPERGTPGGNSTRDTVFLLSIDEINQYLPEEETRKATPTAYAAAMGGGGWWWLRTPGHHSKLATYIYSDGVLYRQGTDAYWGGRKGGGIRPAFWMSLEF